MYVLQKRKKSVANRVFYIMFKYIYIYIYAFEIINFLKLKSDSVRNFMSYLMVFKKFLYLYFTDGYLDFKTDVFFNNTSCKRSNILAMNR